MIAGSSGFPGLRIAILLAMLAATGCRTMALAPPVSGAATGAPHTRQDASADETRRSVSADTERALDRIFRDDTMAEQALDPIAALERGEVISPDAFRLLFTSELVRRQRDLNEGTLARLSGIDRAALGDDHRISFDVFRQNKLDQRALLAPGTQALLAVQPFSHFGGFHVEFPQLASAESSAPMVHVADFEARIALDRALPDVFDTAIARFREGMATGVVEPRVIVNDMITQIDAILAQPPAQSLFMAPTRRFPRHFGNRERKRLRLAFANAVTGSVYPAYSRLRAFLADEYLPSARQSTGLSSIQGGMALYRLLIRQHTSLDLDPVNVHQLGLSEVARIRLEMDRVRQQIGFAGDLRAFFDEVRTNPIYHPRNVDDLFQGYSAVGEKVSQLVPRYFRQLPRTPLVIEPYPRYRARFEAGGGYAQGMPDGSMPGVFFFNSYDLPGRSLAGVTTLYLHEGAPGHHFQISLAQENESLPDFQRFGGSTAYVEGWALYAETLGYEMGLYDDPVQHWGTLDDEMLRAMRLVVDTGLHAQEWSRDQAVDYMLTNSGLSRTDAEAEVDRYIASPAQALAYKIGGLTIQRLRRKAEAALGPRFDIRAFHEQVLGSGALPLPVLEAKIDRWIERGGA